MKSTLFTTNALLEQINKHAKEDYPYECCGILIGSFETRELKEIMPASNIRKDRLNDRFEISGEELVKGETRASKLSLDVIGYYHSHPDHPNTPSEYDRQRAFPGMSYIIVSVEKKEKTYLKSFVLSDDTKQFEEENVNITNTV